VLTHGHDLRYDGLVCPFDAKYLGKLLQILSGGFADGEDGVAKPAHAETAELLVEKLHAKLRGEKRNVFDNGQPYTPLLVLGELDDSRKKRLREQFNANDYLVLVFVGLTRDRQRNTIVDKLELGDDIQSNIRELVLEHLQEHRK
jgi:hypothetical protein